MEIVDAGSIGYADGLELQQSIWQEVVNQKQDSTLIFCEHPPVYTLGKNAKRAHLLIGQEQLTQIGASVYQTDRGGDITFHGPGQLVGYPIIRLEDYHLGVRRYVDILEDSLIETCKEYDIISDKIHGLTGIWIKDNAGHERKIAAIGIKVSRGVTMHGFALNVYTSLDYFNYMIPCGIADKSVTSIFEETNKQMKLEHISKTFAKVFQNKIEM